MGIREGFLEGTSGASHERLRTWQEKEEKGIPDLSMNQINRTTALSARGGVVGEKTREVGRAR